jgi:very-short-patch-repair endonuclease
VAGSNYAASLQPEAQAAGERAAEEKHLGGGVLVAMPQQKAAAWTRFHRQRPIDEYIMDFFAPDLMLAIEVDGSSHKLKGTDDEARQRRLEKLGIRFLRFTEMEVRKNLDGVVGAIDSWILANAGRRQF